MVEYENPCSSDCESAHQALTLCRCSFCSRRSLFTRSYFHVISTNWEANWIIITPFEMGAATSKAASAPAARAAVAATEHAATPKPVNVNAAPKEAPPAPKQAPTPIASIIDNSSEVENRKVASALRQIYVNVRECAHRLTPGLGPCTPPRAAEEPSSAFTRACVSEHAAGRASRNTHHIPGWF
jgi:hypothetical protein